MWGNNVFTAYAILFWIFCYLQLNGCYLIKCATITWIPFSKHNWETQQKSQDKLAQPWSSRFFSCDTGVCTMNFLVLNWIGYLLFVEDPYLIKRSQGPKEKTVFFLYLLLLQNKTEFQNWTQHPQLAHRYQYWNQQPLQTVSLKQPWGWEI